MIGILHSNERSLLNRNRSDSGSHESGSEDSHFFDRNDLGQRRALLNRDARVFLERRRGKKDVDQLAADVSHRHLAKQPRLGAIAMTCSAAVSGLDCVDSRKRSGIVSAGLLHRLFARFLQHDATTGRILVQKKTRHAARVLSMLDRSVGKLLRALNRDLAENRRVDELIDQSDLHRLLRANVPAGENHVERSAHADQPRKPLRSSCPWYQADLNFRKRKNCLWMIGRDPVVRCKRKLERPAHARAVDCDHERSSLLVNRIEKQLSLMTQSLRFSRALELEKLLDVGAGNETVLLSADENGSANVEIALETIEERDELILHSAIELVDRIAGKIDRDHRDAVDDLRAECVGRCHQPRSTTIANPIPPAAHTVISPNCPSRRRSSLSSVTVMRDPVAPNGCPIAIDPPMTLSRD